MLTVSPGVSLRQPISPPRPFDERSRLRAMLARPLPEIPPIYFYDDEGSALFEQITRLAVYYQTRAEIGILERSAAAILEVTRPRHLVELGSGAGRKIRLLLDAWSGGGTCTMLDVNALFLEGSLGQLRRDYPRRDFRGVVGDFTTDLGRLGPGGGRLTMLFGGTVGNLYPGERRAFFQDLARGMEASMRLRASRPMRVQLPALDLVLDLSLGAELRTEVSCKFTLASLAESAAEGGLALSHWYGDPEGLFALVVLRRAGLPQARSQSANHAGGFCSRPGTPRANLAPSGVRIGGSRWRR